MRPLMKVLTSVCLVLCLFLAPTSRAAAQTGPATSILWWNGMRSHTPGATDGSRSQMADHVNNFSGGQVFEVTFRRSTRGGALAQTLSEGRYAIVVLDITDNRIHLNTADTEALKRFYASGRNALMLDGSFMIRSMPIRSRTRFPGSNGSSAALLVNQLTLLQQAGGGILIGADHGQWQNNPNKALKALLPGVAFKGVTNPSTDGHFIGRGLLETRVWTKPIDILKHWESVPNQGEAPVGQFTDFLGRPVTLHALVESADKPGGGRKRPYISASFAPDEERIAIDSDDDSFGVLPTHKSGN